MKAGSAACDNCPVGKSTSKVASTSKECEVCDLGKYNAKPGSMCLDCKAGYFNERVGASACIPCQAGKYLEATGARTSYDCTGVCCWHLQSTHRRRLFRSLSSVRERALGFEQPRCRDLLPLRTHQRTIQRPHHSRPHPRAHLPCPVQRAHQQPHRERGQPADVDAHHQAQREGPRVRHRHLLRGRPQAFNNLGLFYDRYYLSLFVYDTGFGPLTHGEYVEFTINGQTVMTGAAMGNVPLQCAPVTNDMVLTALNSSTPDEDGIYGCTGTYHACAYNIDVTDQSSSGGGSVNIGVRSIGVVTSGCPYINPEIQRTRQSS